MPIRSKQIYKTRTSSNASFGRIKQFLRIATRYDRLAIFYLVMAKLAATRFWLRAYETAA